VSASDWERILREGFDAFNEGDWEAVLEHASEDVEVRRIETSPDSMDVVRGREQVRAFLRPDAFADQHIEVLAMEHGADAVYVRMRFTARGAGSGLPVDIDAHNVYRFAGDRLTSIELYGDQAQARAAAGLG
jgi:ketosteroid isomerase-like protein